MRRVDSAGWLLLFPVVYLAHLADERYFGIGTAEFATRHLGMYFTNSAWWWVNVPSALLLTATAILVAHGTWPAWVVLSLAVHLVLHGLGRVPTSLSTLEVAPGLVTGLLLCTPLALATFWRGRTRFPRDEWTRGVLVGVASFQPLWHFVLLPVLPSGPAG